MALKSIIIFNLIAVVCPLACPSQEDLASFEFEPVFPGVFRFITNGDSDFGFLVSRFEQISFIESPSKSSSGKILMRCQRMLNFRDEVFSAFVDEAETRDYFLPCKFDDLNLKDLLSRIPNQIPKTLGGKTYLRLTESSLNTVINFKSLEDLGVKLNTLFSDQYRDISYCFDSRGTLKLSPNAQAFTSDLLVIFDKERFQKKNNYPIVSLRKEYISIFKDFQDSYLNAIYHGYLLMCSRTACFSDLDSKAILPFLVYKFEYQLGSQIELGGVDLFLSAIDYPFSQREEMRESLNTLFASFIIKMWYPRYFEGNRIRPDSNKELIAILCTFYQFLGVVFEESLASPLKAAKTLNALINLIKVDLPYSLDLLLKVGKGILGERLKQGSVFVSTCSAYQEEFSFLYQSNTNLKTSIIIVEDNRKRDSPAKGKLRALFAILAGVALVLGAVLVKVLIL